MKFNFSAIKLSIFVISVFLVQLIYPEFTELFILDKTATTQFWRFITSIFLHADFSHLALNVFALALFGSILEKLSSSRFFLITFFTTGIFSNVLSFNFYSASLGASGAIFGIIGALILIRPFMVVWAFGMPMPMIVAGTLWITLDFFRSYAFFYGTPTDNIGSIAHLSGIIFGLILGTYYRRKNPKKKRPNQLLEIDDHMLKNWEKNYLR